MRISKEVAEAIVRHKPVVALESTIIAHGMPYPRNLETAKALESAVREEGAVPATIAVIEGEPVVGLSEEELLAIATRKDVMKLSRRDLPIALGLGRWGATTVSATIILAAMAGIEVFATGGIGGVHRGAEDTFDISRDLPELGGNDITVVSSGVKAILDLPKTLEVLETEGVTVLSYQAPHLADFYSQDSGLAVDYVAKTPEEIARIVRARRSLHLKGGILVSNPCPAELALPREKIDPVIEKALEEAEKEGVHGKASTPYLLAKIVELSGGKSLEANVGLAVNNARLGAKIAVVLSKLEEEDE